MYYTFYFPIDDDVFKHQLKWKKRTGRPYLRFRFANYQKYIKAYHNYLVKFRYYIVNIFNYFI